ncbi:hypothetical protein WKW79_33700 [Variovorax robiniae]|uniref:AP2 domain-containing protein n=1 Tax=Variovorax robiniae TaxID=1836199 RepID=A0ABU8XI43_9BURK
MPVSALAPIVRLMRRDVTLPSGETLRVPRHIKRLDTASSTHGWQVHYKGHTKYFADSGRSNPRGTPRSALGRASRYLAEIYSGRPSMLHPSEHINKIRPTGVPGVRVIHRLERKGAMRVTYVEVYDPQKQLHVRRFYVGTDRTVTPQRLADKLKVAKAYRRMLVDAYLECCRHCA